jgi:acetyl esterase/lipase
LFQVAGYGLRISGYLLHVSGSLFFVLNPDIRYLCLTTFSFCLEFFALFAANLLLFLKAAEINGNKQMKHNSHYIKIVFINIVLFFVSQEIFAQSIDTIYLWSGSIPGATEPKHAPVPTTDTSGGVIRLTDVTNPALIVFKPVKSTDKGNSIIVCPGGAYKYLAINIEGYEVANWLNKQGFTAYVLQYRVPGKREEAFIDIQRAIRIVRSCTSGITGVIGFSAGGNLCARAGIDFAEESYAITDSIDSISCRPDFVLLIYPAYLDEGENRSLSPNLHLNKNIPPMFIFQTADDMYGNSSLVMAAALRKNKIPVELHLLPSGGHGYGLRTGNIAAETWPHLAEIWLKNYMTQKQ